MVTTRSFATGTTLALLAVLELTACGEKVECAPGTENIDGTCVAICEDGTEPDPTTGACVPVCMPGTQRHPSSGGCVPTNQRCEDGHVWEPDSASCLPLDGLCAAGTVWVAGEARCVPKEELRVPDQFEGDEPNNWGPAGGVCEQFPLPSIGESYSIGGRIDPPDVRLPVPDMDCWNFTTDGPTLLRIHADGYGGAAVGFKVVRDDDGAGAFVDRVGAGTSSESVTRDLFLPRSTRYALIVTDVMHLIPNNGVARGSEDFGYYVEIERLPMPEPSPLSGTGVIGRGRWTPELPENGTNLGFFEIPVEKNTLMHLGLWANNAQIRQIFAAVGPTGAVIEAAFNRQPFADASDRDGAMLMVADYEWWFAGQGEQSYTITRRPQPFEIIGSGVTHFEAHRPGWRPQNPMPARYYGFNVVAGDVQRIALHASTGYTCFTIWDLTFTVFANSVGCYTFVSEPIHDLEITFISDYDGMWVLTVIDWSDGNWVDGALISMPARDFEFEVGIHPQTPIALGDISSPIVHEEQITDIHPERWFTFTPSEAGQAFRFEVESSDMALPLAFPLDYGGDIATPRHDHTLVPADSLIVRVPDGRERLLRVLDYFFGTGSFHLYAERYEPVPLEIPPGGATLSTSITTGGGERRHFEVRASEPSDLHLTLIPPPGTEIAYVPAHANYRQGLEYMKTNAGSGEPLKVIQGVKHIPFAFEITDPHGDPLQEEVDLQVEARFVPLRFEQPAEFPDEATPLPLFTPIAAEQNGPYETHWYRIEIDGPSMVEVSTRPWGLGIFGRSTVNVFDANLRAIENLERIASFHYPTLRFPADGPATYFVLIRPRDDEWGGYVVEATVSDD